MLKKYSRFILSGVLVIVLLLLIASSFINRSTKQVKITQKAATVENVNIKQKIYISQKDIRENNISINQGTTALDLLQQTSQVEIKGDGKNAFVVSVGGLKADEKKKEFWAFYVNDKQALVGVGSYILKDKDKIEWKIKQY